MLQLVKVLSFLMAFHSVVVTQQGQSALQCSNYFSTKLSTCQEIFQQLQKQIVDSDSNLYSLRKVFYPTSATEPALVNVSYDLTVVSSRNVSCPGDPESTFNPRYDRLPANLRGFLKVHAWSSKLFYTLFHPGTINRLQPQLLQRVLGMMDNIYATSQPIQTALTWSTVGPILTVELSVDLQLSCWPTLLALEGSLNDLTSALKIYADSGENVSSWGADEKGYALLGTVFIDRWWLFNAAVYPSSNSIPLVNGILSVIVTLMICFGVYYALWTVAPANSEQKNFLFSYSVVWSGVAILLIFNIVLLISELESIDLWCQVRSCTSETASASKIVWLIWMACFMIVAFIVLLIRFLQGKMNQRDLFVPEWRAFIIATPLLSTFVFVLAVCYKLFVQPLLRFRQVRNMWVHLMETLRWAIRIPRPVKSVIWKIVHFTAIYILYMTVFVSASILTFSIVPILLQTFLFPFRIIAAYSYFFIAFCLYYLAAFMAVFLWKEKPPKTGRLILYLSSTTVTITFIAVVSVPFISLYQLLVSGGFSDNPIVLFAISVLPSLLLSSPLVWLFKSKLLPRFLEVEEDDEEQGGEDEEDKKVKAKPRETMGSSGDSKIELASL